MKPIFGKLLFIILLAVFMFTGCNGGEESQSSVTEGISEGQDHFEGEESHSSVAEDVSKVQDRFENEGFLFEKNEYGYTLVGYHRSDSDVVIPESHNGTPVTAIDKNVFSRSDIKSIVIPGSIAVIPDYAFMDCRSLTEVTILEGTAEIGESAFLGCFALEKVTLPESVKTIKSKAFSFCSSLYEINIPAACYENDSVSVFEHSGLHELNIPNKVKSIPSRMFAFTDIKALTLPYALETIKESAFEGAPLEKVEFNSNLKKIEQRAFYGTNIKSVVLPDSLKSVGVSAFESSPLESAEFGKGVETIGQRAFYGTCLTEVTLPENAKTFYENSFDGNMSFKRLTYLGKHLPKDFIDDDFFTKPLNMYEIRFDKASLRYINEFPRWHGHKIIVDGQTEEIFVSGGFEYYKYTVPSEQKEVAVITRYLGDSSDLTLPAELDGLTVYPNCLDLRFSNVETIRYQVVSDNIPVALFKNCYGLKSVIIPPEILYINDEAFSGCVSLESINLSDNVATISSYAFKNCQSLKEIHWSENLWMIGQSAFYGCKSLEKVELKKEISQVENYAFYGCTDLKEVVITSPNLVVMGNYCFAYTGIREFNAHPELRAISTGMFSHSALEKITLTPNCDSIHPGAFEYTNITELVVPVCNYFTMNFDIFVGCREKVKLKFEGDAPESVPDVHDYEACNFSVYYHDGNSGFLEEPWIFFDPKTW